MRREESSSYCYAVWHNAPNTIYQEKNSWTWLTVYGKCWSNAGERYMCLFLDTILDVRRHMALLQFLYIYIIYQFSVQSRFWELFKTTAKRNAKISFITHEGGVLKVNIDFGGCINPSSWPLMTPYMKQGGPAILVLCSSGNISYTVATWSSSYFGQLWHWHIVADFFCPFFLWFSTFGMLVKTTTKSGECKRKVTYKY